MTGTTKKFFRSAATILLSAGAMVSVQAGAASAMSLEEAVQITIRSNPAMMEARANYRAINKELSQARSRYLPQLDVEVAYGPEYSDNPRSRDRTEFVTGLEGPGVWENRFESGFVLSETLFDGFERRWEVRRQKARVNSADSRIGDRAERLALDVVRAYLETVRRERILGLAGGNLQVHADILNDVRQRVDAGQSPIADQQQAEARLASAQVAVTQALRDLDESRITFARLVGQYPDTLSTPTFDSSLMSGSSAEAVEIAVTRSPLVLFAKADANAAYAASRGTEARFYPEISVELRGSSNENIDGVRGDNEDFAAMVRMRYNLYRGGGDRARAQEARERHSESLAVIAKLQRDIEEETRQSWSLMERKDREISDRQAAVTANSQVARTYQQEFQIGRRDLLDLLDSENQLFLSQVELTTAQTDALFARYRVLASVGRLTAAMGVTSYFAD
jgi:adhesin transport system outer membrane protein